MDPDQKIWQEFYCNDCDGYWRVKLCMQLNIRVEMVCPNCGRKHPRCIKDGKIYENADVGSYTEEVLAPKSSYSKEPVSNRIKRNARDGAVISEAEHIRDPIMRELWLDYFGGGESSS